MSARRPLLALALLLGVTAARAEEPRTVAVVLDRSGSLRHADPAGKGPRLLAAALALSLEPGDRLLLLGGEGGAPEPLTDLAALAGRISALVAASSPQDGGADLGPLLVQAAERAGERGVVLVLTDDDLDVVDAQGRVPEEVRERARALEPRPARDAINRAARLLLAERLRALPGRRLVGLRAPLPPGARSVPFLEAVGAKPFELEGDPDELLAGLVEELRGDPAIGLTRQLAEGGALDLPGASRVVLLGEARLELPGARALDPEGRLVVLDVPGGGRIQASAAARAWVSPRVPLPDSTPAFALRGAARVVVQGGDPHGAAGQLVLRWGSREAPLQGDPLSAELPPAAGPLQLLRVVTGEGGRRAVAARRELFPNPVALLLEARGQAVAGIPVELNGAPPPELAWREPVAVRLRGPGGRTERVRLEPEAAGRFAAGFTPPSEGSWEVEGEGLLPVRLSAPLVAAPGLRCTIRIEELLGPDGKPFQELELTDERAELRLRLVAEPALPTALPLRLVLNEAPAGAGLSPRGALELRDRTEATLDLTWPGGAGDVQVTLRVLGPEGANLTSASRAFLVHAPRSLLRRLGAAGALSLALVWGLVVLLRRRRRRAEELEAARRAAEEAAAAEAAIPDEPPPRELHVSEEVASRLGTRQIRGVGGNGKMSIERYAFLDHSREDSSVVISPEDSSVGVELHVREDGTVKARGVDGAKLIHEDRPTILSEEATLRHGTAFAVVEGQKARRFVYLERDPTADELQTRFVEGTVSQEAELHDSGIFVVLDDHHEVAPESARMLQFRPGILGRDPEESILDEGDEIEDSSESATISNVEAEPPRTSDEGEVVYMDSDESEILDSDDQPIPGTDQGPLPEGSTRLSAPPLPTLAPLPPTPAPAVPPAPLPHLGPPEPPRPLRRPGPPSDVVGGSASDEGPG